MIFRLCESYRDEFGMPRQRMVLGLGRLLEIPDVDQKILLASWINELIKGKSTLFNTNKDQAAEKLAQRCQVYCIGPYCQYRRILKLLQHFSG